MSTFTPSPNRPAFLQPRAIESPQPAWDWLSTDEQRGTHRWLDVLERLGWRFGLRGGQVVCWPVLPMTGVLRYTVEANVRPICLAVRERVVSRITAGDCIECGARAEATYCRPCYQRRETKTREINSVQPVLAVR